MQASAMARAPALEITLMSLVGACPADASAARAAVTNMESQNPQGRMRMQCLPRGMSLHLEPRAVLEQLPAPRSQLLLPRRVDVRELFLERAWVGCVEF